MKTIVGHALRWSAARASEPSTWAGLAAAIGGLTFLPHAREGADIASGIGLIVCALVAIARKEKGVAGMIDLFRAAHATALKKLIDGLPVADLSAAIAGRANLDDDFKLAEELAGLVGAAFPPAALTAAEVALALEGLRLLLDAARVLPAAPRVTGGYPDIVGQENATNFRDR